MGQCQVPSKDLLTSFSNKLFLKYFNILHFEMYKNFLNAEFKTQNTF